MAINRYFTFPKAPGREPNHQSQFSIIPGDSLRKGSYPFYRGAMGAFSSPNRWRWLIRSNLNSNETLSNLFSLSSLCTQKNTKYNIWNPVLETFHIQFKIANQYFICWSFIIYMCEFYLQCYSKELDKYASSKKTCWLRHQKSSKMLFSILIWFLPTLSIVASLILLIYFKT